MANFKIKEPEYVNYCGIVCKIENIVTLENCDNLVHAIIFGNRVIVTKDVTKDTVGVFFPCGTKMSDEFLKMNNMYSKSELNQDTNVRGYFGSNGLVRCVKLRGNPSEGLFVPLDSIRWFLKPNDVLEVGDSFDTLNDHVICKKYIPVEKTIKQTGFSRSKNDKKIKKISRMVENQFRFHIDTQLLYRNLHNMNRNDLISVTYKIHGTSGISSYILCKKEKLNVFEWIQSKLFKKHSYEYDYVYSSRKVIKNEFFTPKHLGGYYKEDIWKVANDELKPFLKKGMTFYYEIAGYLQSGGQIQKDYVYGCKPKEHIIYIYRITYTNVDGDVYEFSMKQVQDFCKERGLNAVPLLYYGTVEDYVQKHYTNESTKDKTEIDLLNDFLKFLKEDYNEKDCYICKTGVPEEGCVVRKEINGIESYKVKSTRFLEKESLELESGKSNIEDQN